MARAVGEPWGVAAAGEPATPKGASAVRSPAALVAAALDGVAGCRLEPGEGAARIMVAIGWWVRWGGGFVVYVCGLCECV